MSHYIVKTASVSMPAKVRSPYRRVAVLEVEDGVASVSMISSRARGVVRVVHTWERLNVGRNVRSAFAVALRHARNMAEDMNGGAR